MCVFRVWLPLCCVSVVPFVLYYILLHFASVDDYSHSVCLRLLQVVVFVCELVDMSFLRRCCVFFSISLLFLVLFDICNICQGAAVRESFLLPFTCFFVLRALFNRLDTYCPSAFGSVEYVRACVLSIFTAPLAFYLFFMI